MKKSKIITDSKATEWQCEFCNKTLLTEIKLAKHTCPQKSRWLDRDTPTSRLAFACWKDFYTHTQPSKKCEIDDFVRSQYYGAFWRFADYCRSIKAVNVSEFQKWLLKNRHSVDRWTSDSLYTQFLLYYLPCETPLDSVYRSVETIIKLSGDTEYSPSQYLRYAGKNKICLAITQGQITAWLLYNCDAGVDFIQSLDRVQVGMIWDYIEPEPWTARFLRHDKEREVVKEVLKQGGF